MYLSPVCMDVQSRNAHAPVFDPQSQFMITAFHLITFAITTMQVFHHFCSTFTTTPFEQSIIIVPCSMFLFIVFLVRPKVFTLLNEFIRSLRATKLESFVAWVVRVYCLQDMRIYYSILHRLTSEFICWVSHVDFHQCTWNVCIPTFYMYTWLAMERSLFSFYVFTGVCV